MDKLVERLLAWSETPFEGDPMIDALLSDVPEAGRRIQALEAELAGVRTENADLKQSVIAFCAPWADEYARSFGLERNEMHPGHYDILAKCGARMDSFRRAILHRGEVGG